MKWLLLSLLLILQLIHAIAQNAGWIQQSPPVTQTLLDVTIISPGVIIAVGTDGTIIKSSDGGNTWAKKNSTTSNTLNGVDFMNNTLGYAVGSSGTVLKTTDAGESWVKQNSGVSTTLYSVSFTSNNIGWITGFNRTVLRTTDGGTTWSSQYSAATLTFLEDVDAISQQNAVAVGWGSGDFNKTTDGGLTWTGSDLAGWAKGVDFLNDTLGWVAGITASYISVTLDLWGDIYSTINGEKATIWKTKNGGGTWSPFVFSSNAQWLNDITVVNADKVYAVGGKGLIAYTTNGGLNWTLQCDPRYANVSFNAIAFESPSTGYIVGNNGTILKTENDGISWTQKGTSGTTNYLNSVCFINSATGWAAGNKGTIVKTTDGGKNWVTQTSGVTGFIRSVCFTDSLNGWCSVNDGTILNTTNSGSTWSNQTSHVSSVLYSVHFIDKNNGWAVGSDGIIIHTSDGGLNWTRQTSGTTASLYTLFFINTTTGCAGGSDGTLLRTKNGGVSWTETKIKNSDSYSSVKDIQFIDEKTGWCIGDWIMKTTDGGETWVKQFGNMNEYYEYNSLNALYFINAQTGWISASAGKILKTADGGNTWGITSAGNNTGYYDTRFTSQLTGWVVGYDGYIMKTDNGGGTFTPLEYLNITTLVKPSDGEYFVSMSPTLRWNSAGQGSKYEVRLVADGIYNNDSVISAISGVTDTFLVIDKRLQPDKFHYWKVRLVGNNGIKGNWSKQFAFRTQSIPNCIPTLYTPFGNDESDKFAVKFEWYCYLADSFRFQVSTDSTFSKNLKADSLLNVANIKLLLDHHTTYFWRVKQVWGTSPRDWSKKGIFTTPEKVPFISLVQPSLYENLAIGTVYKITWTDNISTKLKVSLYNNSALVFDMGSTLSTSFDWSIPPSIAPGDNYSIMVKDTLSGTFSKSDFLRINYPYINISMPSSSSYLAKGSMHNDIFWTDNLPGKLVILLYKAGILLDTLGIASGSDMIYFWNIPGNLTSGADYQIQIKDIETGISGKSPDFSIDDPFITISNPTAGALWVKGTTNNWIGWSDNSQNKLTIYLYKAETLIGLIGTSSSSFATNLNWTIPSSLPSGTDYRIVIKDTLAKITGTSGMLAIEDPYITVSNPAPGIEWQRSSGQKRISWFSNYYEIVMVLLFKGDVLKDTIGFTTSKYQQFYYWDIPAELTLGTDYKIAVKDAAKNITGSSGFFTISVTGLAIPGIPTLLSPLNNDKDIPLNEILHWNKITEADSYSVQVSTSPDFSTILFDPVGLTSTMFIPAGLVKGTKYYWRVNASNSGGKSAWSEIWNFTTVPSIYIPSLISPANNSSNQPLSVTLTWVPQDGVSFTLQVSTVADFSTTVVSQSGLTSTNYSPAGLAGGTKYFWRVNATNAGGTSAWSETWNFTTISGISTPAVQASNMIVSGINGNSATVKWTKGNGSKSVVFVKQGADGTPAPVDNTSCTADAGFGKGSQIGNSGWYCVFHGSDSTVTISGLSSLTTYKVMAISLNGNAGDEKYLRQSAAGNPVTFTTTCDFDHYGTNPEVHLYFKNATTYDVEITNSHSCGTTTFKFQNIALTGNSFNINVSSYPNAGSMQGTLSADGNSFTGTYNINYAYLHPVYGYAVSCGTKSGSWSASRKFTGPAAPVLVSPANNLVNLLVAQLLKWNPSAGAVSYSLQVSKYVDFSTILISQHDITATEFALSGLDNNSTYYWRVAGGNECYRSNWSEVRNFTTLPWVPEIPVLAGPAYGSINQPLSFTVAWNPAERAESYSLQVSTQTDFSTTIISENNLTTTFRVISSLSNSTLYYWRVRASNVAGVGGWSQVWNFTTANPVGIDELLLYNQVKIYPNPASGKITVEFSQSVTGEAKIKLYEPSGRMVLTKPLVSQKSEIDISGLVHGIYFAEIQSGILVLIRKLVII